MKGVLLNGRALGRLPSDGGSNPSTPTNGYVAQVAERSAHNAGVGGSSPLVATKNKGSVTA